MTIAASSLITPNGPLSPVLFPNTDAQALETKVAVLLAKAYDDQRVEAATESDDSDEAFARQDRMATALALYWAYGEVYQRMVAEPLTVKIEEKGSHGYSKEQLTAMKELRDGYLAQFTDELDTVVTDSEWGTSVARRAS